MGSVVVSRKVESWAGSETAGMTNSQAESQNVGAQYAAPLPQRMARSPDVTSELVAQRHQQRSRQNRAREEQAAFKTMLSTCDVGGRHLGCEHAGHPSTRQEVG